MQKRVTIRRLETLARFLETKVPRKHFDMDNWVQHTAPGECDAVPEIPRNAKLGDCGTAGCAMGWATTIPSFKSAGLRLCDSGFGQNIKFKTAHGWVVPMYFFGISHSQAEFIFDGHEYPGNNATPKQVAKRIRKFVAELRAA